MCSFGDENKSMHNSFIIETKTQGSDNPWETIQTRCVVQGFGVRQVRAQSSATPWNPEPDI